MLALFHIQPHFEGRQGNGGARQYWSSPAYGVSGSRRRIAGSFALVPFRCYRTNMLNTGASTHESLLLSILVWSPPLIVPM